MEKSEKDTEKNQLSLIMFKVSLLPGFSYLKPKPSMITYLRVAPGPKQAGRFFVCRNHSKTQIETEVPRRGT